MGRTVHLSDQHRKWLLGCVEVAGDGVEGDDQEIEEFMETMRKELGDEEEDPATA